jgi:hypothetical protein
MSEYFDGLVSNGVYESVGGGLQVLASEGMTVAVQTGRGVINCKWLKNDSVLPLDITAAHALLNRITSVVLRLDMVNRLMEIDTKDGTNASSPEPPALQNDSEAIELCLANIYVAAGTTSISQANITDMRPSSSCGWVTGLIEQVDTSTLFLQYQAAYENYYATMTAEFEEWFDTLSDKLNINTYIREFEKSVTISTAKYVVLDMTNYEYSEADVIYVYINGLLASEGTDWTLSTSGATPRINVPNTEAGAEVTVKILKSKIGFNTLIGSDDAEIVNENSETVYV